MRNEMETQKKQEKGIPNDTWEKRAGQPNGNASFSAES
jgi:hypothetical protein